MLAKYILLFSNDIVHQTLMFTIMMLSFFFFYDNNHNVKFILPFNIKNNSDLFKNESQNSLIIRNQDFIMSKNIIYKLFYYFYTFNIYVTFHIFFFNTKFSTFIFK
jgi:hypothetical protein